MDTIISNSDSDQPRAWHVYSTDGLFGPYTAREIRRYRAEGLISDDHYVYREGLGGWMRLGEIADLPPAPPFPRAPIPGEGRSGPAVDAAPRDARSRRFLPTRRAVRWSMTAAAAAIVFGLAFLTAIRPSENAPAGPSTAGIGAGPDGRGGAKFSLPLSPTINRASRAILRNGMTVIVRPVREADSVALALFYSIGGDHDPEGKSGLAHLLEHMYVVSATRGSAARTADEIRQRYPGGWNAQTGDDFTVFASVFSSSDLEREIEEAAERMSDLRMDSVALDREKSRVIAELRGMYGGHPALAAMNNARELAAPSPVGGRKGGIAECVRGIALDELADRWKRLYKPANAVLVLTGGFEPRSTVELLARRFAEVETGETVVAPPPRLEPEMRGLQRVAVDPQLPGAQSHACVGFRAPDHRSDLFPAYLVHVVRMWILSAKINFEPGQFPPPVYYAPLDDHAAFFVNSPVSPGESRVDAVNRLEAYVKESTSGSLEPGDISTTLDFFGPFLGLADLPEDQLSGKLYGLAFSLGRSEQLGINPEDLRKRIENVTSEDLRRAAEKIFSIENRSAVVAVVEGGNVLVK